LILVLYKASRMEAESDQILKYQFTAGLNIAQMNSSRIRQWLGCVKFLWHETFMIVKMERR